MSITHSPRIGADAGEHVGKRVRALQEGYLRDSPAAVSRLAVLRRGVGLPLGRDIELTGLAIGGLYPDDAHLPDAPTDAEHAAYTAVTLFAVHQQSQRSQRMHRPGYSFGRSARLLSKQSGADDAVRRRFTALGTATNWGEIVHHARGLVQQLRAYGIPLDYERFTRDLLALRRRSQADRVRNAWGRDFYRIRFEGDDAEIDAREDAAPAAPDITDN